MKTIVIQPRSSWTRQDWEDILEFRWVFWMLILRDIKLRYKQTYLGIAWVVLQPLATALLFAVVFGKWMHISSGNVPYFLFAFCGLIPWLVFSQSVQRAGSSLVNEAHLVRKVYFPRLFLPLSGTFGVAVDYLIALITFFLLLPFFSYGLTWKCLFLPFCGLLVFLFSSGVNILLSALSVQYRDFKHIVPFFLQFWMYASPLAYSIETIPEKWHWLFCLNPLTGIIDFFRWTLLGLDAFPFVSLSAACITTLILLLSSLFLFRKLERTFTDVI